MVPSQRSIERIRAFAKQKGWRNARLAREAGLHMNTLRSFDDPDWNPRLETVQKLERLIPADFMPDDMKEAS